LTTRDYLIDAAASKLGDYRKGSPEVFAIWRDVLDPAKWSDAQVRQYAAVKDWCGGFVLHCLREARLLDTYWQDGSGFVLRVLGAKAAVKVPEPGDIGILRRRPGATKDVWHHYLVSRWAGPSDWESIDGNAPCCERKPHTSVLPTTTFYSIAKLLPEMPEAGFSRDDPFAVSGVQEPEQ
jgi:hypothetical protein